MKALKRPLVSLLLTIAVSSCSFINIPEPTVSPIATQVLTPTPESTPTPNPTPLPGLITLSLWVPDFLNPYDEMTGASMLSTQLESFTQGQRDVQVEIQVKKAKGAGGLYHLLSTAHVAAPDVLPDIVVLSQVDFQAAIRDGILQPIDASASANADFFPFTLPIQDPDNQSYGIPYVTRADQAIYRQGISASPPISWSHVIEARYSLLFPAAPIDGLADDALLAAYLGTGGLTVDEAGNPDLEREKLEELYRFFATAIEEGLINRERVLTLSNASACWDMYQQGIGRLSPVPAGQYWQSPLQDSLPSWIPTLDGTPIAIGHVWYLAIITEDPIRQEFALSLARWLAAPEQSADLTMAIGMLPGSRDALQQWSLLPEEIAFLEEHLTYAVPELPAAINEPVRRALQSGLTALLKEEATTPEDAATYALTQLR